MNAQTYNVIGLMSGTSLDGLDIAYCKFQLEGNKWKYSILEAETILYTQEWKQTLLSLEHSNAISFQKSHLEYGFYIGQRVSDFIIKHNAQVDFVSSHGHTIFHQPENKLTVQIGAGAAIASRCNLPVACDFRTLDVALGGQGAPLVPIGDKLLFEDYDYCLNLGGFANISYEHNANRIAFDICPVNIVMNAICEPMGKAYDMDGDWAREGKISLYLLNELNQIHFYKQISNTPKSLGKEWVLKNIFPLLNQYELEPIDVLRTYCEHIAIQISKSINDKKKGKVLITGGGAYNIFLIERIQKLCSHEIVIPDKKTIEFKEALIFAFLGVLRMRNEVNCLKSVTGASKDTSGGAIYWK